METLMRVQRAWIVPEEEARSLLQIEEKIRSSDIQVPDRDRLIRFRTLLEEDLGQEVPAIVVRAHLDHAPGAE
jgi:hypothetical protein